MKRRFRVLAKVAAGVALLVVVALLLPWVVDIGEYKTLLVAEARQRSGLPLRMEGALGFSLLPAPAVTLEGVVLDAPPGFGGPPPAKVRRATVQMQLWPLFEQRLEVDSVGLEGVELQLVRDAQGRGNWQFPEPEGGRAGVGTDAEGGGKGDGMVAWALTVGGLRLRDGRVVWEDRLLDRRLMLEGVSLDGGAFEPGRPLPIHAATALRFATTGDRDAGTEPLLEGRLDIRGEALFEPVGGRLQVPNLHLRFDGDGALLDGSVHADLQGELRAMLGRGVGAATAELNRGRLELELDRAGLRGKGRLEGDLALDRLDRRISSKNWRLTWSGNAAGNAIDAAVKGALDAGFDDDGIAVARLAEVEATGEIRQSGARLAGTLQGDLELDRLANRVVSGPLRLRFDAAAPALPGETLQGEAQALLSATLDGAAFHLDKLNLAAGDLMLRGDLKGYNLATNPTFDGHLALPEFDLRALLLRRGVVLPAGTYPTALRRVKAATGFKADLLSGLALRLAPLELEVDESRLNGTLELKGGGIGFDLAVDQLDLDRYWSPPAKGAASSAAAAPDASATPESGDRGGDSLAEGLRRLDAQGTFTIGRFKAQGVQAEQVHLRLKGTDGRWHLDQSVGAFYGGKLEGELGLNAVGDQVELRIEGHGEGVEVGELIRDLRGATRLSGKGRVDAALTATGGDAAALREGLSGTLSMHLREGAIEGIDLAQAIRKAVEEQRNDLPSSPAVGARSEFSELSASGELRDGVLSSRDLQARSAHLQVRGEGELALARERIDFRLGITPIALKKKGVAGAALRLLEGIVVPVRLSGDMQAPKWRVEVPLPGDDEKKSLPAWQAALSGLLK